MKARNLLSNIKQPHIKPFMAPYLYGLEEKREKTVPMDLETAFGLRSMRKRNHHPYAPY